MQSIASASRIDFAKLQQSRGYDVLMRFPWLFWSAFAVFGQMVALARYMREGDPAVSYPVWALNVAARTATITFLLLLASAVILRARPTARARGLEPRISAFIGTFLVSAIPLCPRHEFSLAAEMASVALITAGSGAAVFTLLRLGSSFSMMAEARQLVTSGPYRLVRHPLYLAEELAIIGVFIQFISVEAALLLSLQIGFQLRRMHHEEALLADTFPEYTTYRDMTPRLIPRLY